eukprot:5612866-Amphidinium_carterae.1
MLLWLACAFWDTSSDTRIPRRAKDGCNMHRSVTWWGSARESRTKCMTNTSLDGVPSRLTDKKDWNHGASTTQHHKGGPCTLVLVSTL